MELYFTPGACSLAPHIVLREARLPFELRQVDLATKRTADGADFERVNPKGQVPALVLDDGNVLTEVPAVVQYLADLAPAVALAPAPGTLERYRLQEWLNFVTSELHKGLSPLFRRDLDEPWREIIRQTVAGRFDHLERHLGRQEYLLQSGYSAADGYAFAIVNWTDVFDIDLAPWPNLRRYMQRIGARSAVRAALRAEGLESSAAHTAAANDPAFDDAVGDAGGRRG